MSYYPVIGSRCYVSTTIATATAITDITNAAPPVVTSASHGLVDNDEALVLAGWEDFNYSVFRVNQLTTSTLELTGYDATNTDWYPAGSDTGTIAKVSAWQEIGQILGIQGGGGGVRNVTVQPYDRRTPQNIPIGFEAATLSMTLGYDPARADQIALLAASRALARRAIKFALPGSGYAYCYGTVALSPVPNFNPNGVLERTLAISIDGLFTQY
jgi:hypothetical protein